MKFKNWFENLEKYLKGGDFATHQSYLDELHSDWSRRTWIKGASRIQHNVDVYDSGVHRAQSFDKFANHVLKDILELPEIKPPPTAEDYENFVNRLKKYVEYVKKGGPGTVYNDVAYDRFLHQ